MSEATVDSQSPHLRPPALEVVDIALDSGVATILLDRPQVDNAWSIELGEDVSTALRWCDETDDVNIVVLGARGRVFCVGADLSTGQLEKAPSTGGEAGPSQLLPSQIRKPVVAALHGHAVGVGMTFALHCDLRVVADEARFGFPFVRRGLVPEFNSTWLLPRIVGMANALDLCLTGRLLSGSEAVAAGLAHRSAPSESVLAAAQEWAARLATDGSPVAMAATKRLLWSGHTRSPDMHGKRELDVFEQLADAADSTEGIASFLEKRRASWTSSFTHNWPDGI